MPLRIKGDLRAIKLTKRKVFVVLMMLLTTGLNFKPISDIESKYIILDFEDVSCVEDI